jgi:uncharacterized damage-inducible protein DinB
MTTSRELGAVFATKTGAFEKLEGDLRGMSAAQAQYRPPEGAWSVAGVVEHLALVEGQLVQLIATLLKRTEDAGKKAPAGSTFEITVEPFLERSRREKYVTRDKFSPTGKMSMPDALKTLREAHSSLQNLRPRLEQSDLSFATFPHWIFGPLTLGQWLAFIGLHEERHLAQIESIIASPAFPVR